MNLLQYIYENPSHKLHYFFKISSDFTKITSSIDNKEKTIYSDKQIRLEELGRELFLKTEPRITKSNNRKKFIIEEKNIIDNRPSDAILVDLDIKDYLPATIEFKAIKSSDVKNFNSDIETYFSQAENYSKNLIIDKFNKTTFTFCSVVLIDVERIILNPSLIDIYNNSIDFEIKNDINRSLEIFGLYVETRKYLFEDNRLKKTGIKSYNIPVIDFFYKNELPSIQSSLLGISSWTKPAIDAADSITFSSSLGLGNLRETLSPIDNKQKEDLVYEILDTFMEGFQTKNFLCLNKNSNSKSFVFIEDETIVLPADFKDSDRTKIIFISTEGALIDGQQSTSIPFFIKDTLLNNDIVCPKHLHIKNKIKSDLAKISIKNNEQIEDFISFMSNCSFNYNLSIEKDKNNIKKICHSKNKNIPVDKEDNFFLNNGTIYKFLSNKIQEKSGYLCYYPNVSKSYTEIDHTINIKIVPTIFDWYNKFVFEKLSEPFITTFMNGSKKIHLNSKHNDIMKKIVLSETISSKKAISLEKDIDSINNKIKDRESSLISKSSELDSHSEPAVISYITNEIDKINLEISLLKEDLKEKKLSLSVEQTINISKYKIEDDKLNTIVSLVFILLQIKQVIQNNHDLIKQLEIKENLDVVIMRFLIVIYKDKIFLESNEDSILSILKKLVSIKTKYNVQWTDLHSKKFEKLKETNFKNKCIIDIFNDTFI